MEFISSKSFRMCIAIGFAILFVFMQVSFLITFSNYTHPHANTTFAMTCGMKKASHNAGNWKPGHQVDGAKFVLSQLNEVSEEVNFTFGIFEGDEAEKNECEKWKLSYSSVNITCLDIEMKFPQGYGMSKIHFISEIPSQKVIWLDCDAFFISDVQNVLDLFTSTEKSAIFWPDIENHYTPNHSVFKNYGVTLDEKNYAHVTGIDSGLMFINKEKSTKALDFLMGEICANIGEWRSRSSGDKDLWHLAWDLSETEYLYIPWTGGLGHKEKSGDQWEMTGQVKFWTDGRPLVMHQIWTSGAIREYDLMFQADLLAAQDSQGYQAIPEPYDHRHYKVNKTSNRVKEIVESAAKAWGFLRK